MCVRVQWHTLIKQSGPARLRVFEAEGHVAASTPGVHGVTRLQNQFVGAPAQTEKES